jgi:hypothetical protein
VNDTAIIPARVLFQWDFRPYRVCREAKATLDELFFLPAFCLPALNPNLYTLASPCLPEMRVGLPLSLFPPGWPLSYRLALPRYCAGS